MNWLVNDNGINDLQLFEEKSHNTVKPFMYFLFFIENSVIDL